MFYFQSHEVLLQFLALDKDQELFCTWLRIVTTLPLSVRNGALNLSVCVTASNFVPYACDRSVTRGECEGPEVLYRRPLFPVVAWQQNGRTVLRGLSHLCFLFLGGSGRPGPYAGSMSFLFLFVPIPLLARPLYRPQFHISFPKRRSQRGVVVSRA